MATEQCGFCHKHQTPFVYIGGRDTPVCGDCFTMLTCVHWDEATPLVKLREDFEEVRRRVYRRLRAKRVDHASQNLQ